MNTYRIKGSPSREFHKKNFGKESYMDAFVPRFNQAISEWEPKNMAALFKSAGAKYAVLTSKVKTNIKLKNNSHSASRRIYSVAVKRS